MSIFRYNRFMDKINPKIFRAYDIRGIYPRELNEKSAEIVGRAFVKFLEEGTKTDGLEIVLGSDNRASSLSLSAALKKGVLEEGARVIDIGLSPTPVFYFAVWNYGFKGGIQVTASHNPPQYNGFKVVREKAKMVGENSGLGKLKRMALEIGETEGEKVKGGGAKGKEVLEDYIEFNLRGVNLSGIENFKLVIDTGNAVSGVLVERLKKYLPCQIFHLFPELDSRFPNRGLNPLEEENTRYLREAVKEQAADLGMAFDGDGDRVIFIDEKGGLIAPDLVSALISKIILRENKGAKIVYNVNLSNIVREVIEENGGRAIPCRIGHTFVKKEMIEEGAVFGAEYSGHYFHKNHSFCEAPLFVLFKLMEETRREKRSISKLVFPFKKYFYSGVVNFNVREKQEKIKKIEKKYQRGKISRLDGLRVDFPNWWFNVRPSNTEDTLRVTVEAKTKNLMEEKLEEIRKIILEG